MRTRPAAAAPPEGQQRGPEEQPEVEDPVGEDVPACQLVPRQEEDDVVDEPAAGPRLGGEESEGEQDGIRGESDEPDPAATHGEPAERHDGDDHGGLFGRGRGDQDHRRHQPRGWGAGAGDGDDTEQGQRQDERVHPADVSGETGRDIGDRVDPGGGDPCDPPTGRLGDQCRQGREDNQRRHDGHQPQRQEAPPGHRGDKGADRWEPRGVGPGGVLQAGRAVEVTGRHMAGPLDRAALHPLQLVGVADPGDRGHEVTGHRKYRRGHQPSVGPGSPCQRPGGSLGRDQIAGGHVASSSHRRHPCGASSAAPARRRSQPSTPPTRPAATAKIARWASIIST